jgi:hypothetical protein
MLNTPSALRATPPSLRDKGESVGVTLPLFTGIWRLVEEVERGLSASPRYCRRCTWVWQFRLARDTDPLLSRSIGNTYGTNTGPCQGLISSFLPRADRRGGVPRSGEGVVDIALYAEHPLGPAGHSPIAARQGRSFSGFVELTIGYRVRPRGLNRLQYSRRER